MMDRPIQNGGRLENKHRPPMQPRGLGYSAPIGEPDKSKFKRSLEWNDIIDWKTKVVAFPSSITNPIDKSPVLLLSKFDPDLACKPLPGNSEPVVWIDTAVADLNEQLKNGFDGTDSTFSLARDSANPFELISRGSSNFMNRAGMKLVEADICLGKILMVGDGERLAMASVCEGPGCFDEVALARGKFRVRVTAMTLGTSPKDDFRVGAWNKSASSATFEAFYGPTNSGDVTDTRNLDAFCKRVLVVHPHGVHLFTADGGFNVQGYENLQELLSLPMVVAELAGALKCLAAGGNAMIKIFDKWKAQTNQFIVAVAQFFSDVALAPLTQSRPANSELYLFLLGKKKIETPEHQDRLDAVYKDMKEWLESISKTGTASMHHDSLLQCIADAIVPERIWCSVTDVANLPLVNFLQNFTNAYARNQSVYLKCIHEVLEKATPSSDPSEFVFKFKFGDSKTSWTQQEIADAYLTQMDLEEYIDGIIAKDRHLIEDKSWTSSTMIDDIRLAFEKTQTLVKTVPVSLLMNPSHRSSACRLFNRVFELPKTADVHFGILFTLRSATSKHRAQCIFVKQRDPNVFYQCQLAMNLPPLTVLYGFASISNVIASLTPIQVSASDSSPSTTTTTSSWSGKTAKEETKGVSDKTRTTTARTMTCVATVRFTSVTALEINDNGHLSGGSLSDFSAWNGKKRAHDVLVQHLVDPSIVKMPSLLDNLLTGHAVQYATSQFFRLEGEGEGEGEAVASP